MSNKLPAAFAYQLGQPSPKAWLEAVLANFDHFLRDHAAAEKKASGMALSLISHYPDQPLLVEAMLELALEEMLHFREVVKQLHSRGLCLGADTKDTYVNALRKHTRTGTEVYFLDRLLIASLVEARGCERFGLIAEALPEGDLKMFYQSITASEKRHEDLFLRLALQYFNETAVRERLDQLLRIESDIIASLPIQAALH